MAQVKKKPLQLPPILVCLGSVVQLSGDGIDLRWTAKCPKLFCPPDGRSIWAIYAKPKWSTDADFDRAISGREHRLMAALSLYEKWHEFEPISGSLFEQPRGFLFCAGPVDSIVYRSDKWTGKEQKYIHTFDTKPQAYVNRKTDPSIVSICGGRIIIGKDGIKG